MVKRNVFFIINILMTALLSFAGASYGFAFFPVAICMGAYLMYQSYTGGVGRVITLCAVSFASILYAITSPDAIGWGVGLSLTLLLIFCGGGCAMGFTVKAKGNLLSVLCFGALAYLGAFLIWIGMISKIGNVDFISVYINEPITALFENYKAILSAQGGEGGKQLISAFGDLEWYIKEIMAMILPSCFIILCGLGAYIVFGLGRGLIEKSHRIQLEGYPVFSHIHLPRSMSAVFTVLWIISLFAGESIWAGAITNIIIVMSATYMVYGLAIVEFLLKKLRLKTIIRLLIYVAGFFVFALIGLIIPAIHLPTLLLMLGVTDFIFDYRRLTERE